MLNHSKSETNLGDWSISLIISSPEAKTPSLGKSENSNYALSIQLQQFTTVKPKAGDSLKDLRAGMIRFRGKEAK